MSKKILGIAAISFSSVFAGNIMPEMTRSGLNSSDSALGVAWSKRKSVNLQYQTGSTEQEQLGTKTGEVESDIFGAGIFFYSDAFSVEAEYGLGEMTSIPVSGDNTNVDISALGVSAAFRLNESIALVAGTIVAEQKTDGEPVDQRTTTFGGSVNVGNGFILGASYGISNYEDLPNSIDYGLISLGAGYHEWTGRDGFSVEAFFESNSEERSEILGTTLVIPESSELTLQMTYAQAQVQVDASLQSTSTKVQEEGLEQEDKGMDFEVELEYELNSNVYGLAGLSRTTLKETDQSGASDSIEETKSLAVSVGAGYRTPEYDLRGQVAKTTGDVTETGTTTTDLDGVSVTAGFNYNF